MCLQTEEPPADSEKVCKDYYEKKLTEKEAEAKALNVPFLVTEFGGCSNSEACTQDINLVLDVCE